MNNKLIAGIFFAIVLLAACSDDSWVTSALPPGVYEEGEVIGQASVYETTGDKDKLFTAQSDINVISGSESDNATISLDFSDTYQEVEGYGAALTGSSAYLIYKELSSSKRAELLTQLFDPDNGIGISYIRLTIGASDFSLTDFTYCDLPDGETDTDMSEFSIAQDEKNVIPVLKEILAVNSDINIVASPWSAPAWMKSSEALEGGSLEEDYYDAYALYLAKYIEAYAAEGITIDAITIQNEPLYESSSYPTMKMEATAQAAFIKNSLGPLFSERGITTKILIYDHNFDEADYPITVLNDSDANAYITGSAFHAYAGDVSAMSTVHTAHPDKGLYFTEISGGEWSEDFSTNLQYYMSTIFIGTANNWSKNALLWNLALDADNGPANGGCEDCRGVVTIGESNEISYNEEYYALAHIAKYVRPGAVRVGATISDDLSAIECVAFENSDESNVLILLNTGSDGQEFTVVVDDEQFTVTMEASSVKTVIWE